MRRDMPQQPVRSVLCPPPPLCPAPTHTLTWPHMPALSAARDLALVVSFNAMLVDFTAQTSTNLVEPPAPKATGLAPKKKSSHAGKRVTKAPTGVVRAHVHTSLGSAWLLRVGVWVDPS